MALSKSGKQRAPRAGYGGVGYLGDLRQGGVRSERTSFLATRAEASSQFYTTPTSRTYLFHAGVGDKRVTQSYLLAQGAAETPFAFDATRTVIKAPPQLTFKKEEQR